MPDRLKLRVVKDLPKARTYWNTCPRAVGKCCDLKSIGEEESPCPWWINSQEHENCFWTYVLDKSDDSGVMSSLTQSDIAKLFNWSNTRAHFMLKEAMDELTEALLSYQASDLLEESDVEDLSEMSLSELEPEYTEDID